ncbi:MAG: 50S ribosomal protein L23 [Chlamydiales bacterium]|nr:50S ribosomal protein L23 [Chlamydiales bacterium]
MKNPFSIVKERYITEKSTVLESLHTATSNPSLARCENPKYVFIVDTKANKHEIALAVEEIYREQKVRVKAVNTIYVKPKAKNRRRGRPGKTIAFKKAIVTLEPGDLIEIV